MSCGETALFHDAPYKTCTLDSGVPVSWYQRLEDVPHCRPPYADCELHIVSVL